MCTVVTVRYSDVITVIDLLSCFKNEHQGPMNNLLRTLLLMLPSLELRNRCWKITMTKRILEQPPQISEVFENLKCSKFIFMRTFIFWAYSVHFNWNDFCLFVWRFESPTSVYVSNLVELCISDWNLSSILLMNV